MRQEGVIARTATCNDQDIWDEPRRIIERYRAPDEVDDYVARWKTAPRVRITVTPEHIATRVPREACVKQEAASPPPAEGERNENMHGNNRKDIKPGLRVHITQKHDQCTGRLTSGVVKDILTTSAFHSRGIKVRLQTGEVGRVQEIVETSHTQVHDDGA